MVKKMKRKIDKKTTLLPAIFAKKLATWLVILLCISLIFTVIPMVKIVPASSVSWYVATTGSDAAAGDISHPFKTIQHAVDVAQAGHTIYVRGGTYTEAITMKHSGTAGNPITIAGASGETAIIDGTGKSSDNGLIYLNGKDYLTFTNLKVQNSATHGIYTGWESGTNPSTDITVTNCIFNHIGRYGILFCASNTAYPCYRMKVTHCIFNDIQYLRSSEECVGFSRCADSEFAYNKMTKLGKIGFDFGICTNSIAHHNDIDVTDMATSAFGIYVIGGNADTGGVSSGITISNNYIHGNRQCIGVANERQYVTIKDVIIENNVIVATGSLPAIVQFNQEGRTPSYYKNIKIIHNTIYTTGATCIKLEAGSSYMENLVVANNILYGGTAYSIATTSKTITNNLVKNPLFTNTGTGAERYSLQSGSPAIGAASSTYKTTYDFDGNARTSPYDIGAYEYDGQGSGNSASSDSSIPVPPVIEDSSDSSSTSSDSSAQIPLVISQVNITNSDILDIVAGYGWENFTCVVADNDEVSTVLLQLTNPDQSTTNVTMIKITGTTTYFANLSLHQTGQYSYRIQATDTNGNVVISSSYTFWLQPDWDINSDGIVTIADLVLVSNHYGEIGFKGWIREDVDNNGVIQAFDISIVSSNFGRSWWS